DAVGARGAELAREKFISAAAQLREIHDRRPMAGRQIERLRIAEAQAKLLLRLERHDDVRARENEQHALRVHIRRKQQRVGVDLRVEAALEREAALAALLEQLVDGPM